MYMEKCETALHGKLTVDLHYIHMCVHSALCIAESTVPNGSLKRKDSRRCQQGSAGCGIRMSERFVSIYRNRPKRIVNSPAFRSNHSSGTKITKPDRLSRSFAVRARGRPEPNHVKQRVEQPESEPPAEPAGRREVSWQSKVYFRSQSIVVNHLSRMDLVETRETRPYLR